MNKRLEFIDQIRGIAIILVVIGHIIQFNGIQGGLKNSVFMIIYSFHMPLFFFVSGYIGYRTIKVFDLNSFYVHLRKKFVLLCIPLFTWSLLVSKFFLRKEWSSISFNDILVTCLHPGLWFLKTLFEIFVFYGCYAWIGSIVNKGNKLWTDILLFIVILLITSGYSKLCGGAIFSTLIFFSLFFYVGVFISKYFILEKLAMKQWVFASSFIFFIVLCGHWNYNGSTKDDILKIIISVLSFILFLNITIRTKWNPIVSKQIIIFGQYSLSIYLIQFFLTHILVNSPILIFDKLNAILLFVVCFVISIAICYISITFAKIIELNSILNQVLLGKKTNDCK